MQSAAGGLIQLPQAAAEYPQSSDVKILLLYKGQHTLSTRDQDPHESETVGTG